MHLKLEHFDGPLDLLLFLIKAQDLNIFDIPIAQITIQFLDFIRQANKLDIHQAGEYLAMAAQLIEIKTNALLPTLQNQQGGAQNLEEISDTDPRKPLVEQLLEYEQIKKFSEQLLVKHSSLENVFPSVEFKRREDEWNNFERPVKGNPFDLAIVFERILLQYSNVKTLPKVTVHTQKITIEQKMNQIIEKMDLVSTSTKNLNELIFECESRYELIILLMALLELSQKGRIVLIQNNELEDIYISKDHRFSITAENTAACQYVEN